MLKPVDGILFDLDGTLVDSLDLVVACFTHTCRTHLPSVPAREWMLSTIGRPLPRILEELAPGRGGDLLQTWSLFHDEHHDRLLRPYPAALDVVRALHGHGLPLGVVSSKRRKGVARALALYDLTSLFQTVVTLEDTERHKPLPDPLLEGARRLGLPVARLLYVGDSTHDVLAVQGAGMPVAAALWGAGDDAALRALQPDVLLAKPHDLLEWLVARTSH